MALPKLGSSIGPDFEKVQLEPEQLGPGIVFEEELEGIVTDKIRLLFKVTDAHALSSTDWKVFVDSKLNGDIYLEQWSFSHKDIEEQEVWSPEITGDRFRVRLWSAIGELDVKILLEEAIQSRFESTPFALIGENQLISISDAPEAIRDIGKSVVMIKFMLNGNIQTSCTGFFISNIHVLTNHHCISSEKERRSARIYFDFDREFADKNSILPTGLLPLNPDNYKLDYSILTVANSSRPKLQLLKRPLSQQDKLWIIQHPDGKHKQVAYKDCPISDLTVAGTSGEETDFQYGCDTLPGSSGAPILVETSDGEYFLAGIHHLAFEEKDEVTSRFNKGVHIDLVQKSISKHHSQQNIFR